MGARAWWGFLAVVSLGGAACQPGSTQEAAVVAQREIDPPPPTERARSTSRAPQPFALDVTGARDPFEEYLSEPDGEAGAAALERFSLDELRLVGVTLGATPLALVEDPTGAGHVARIGARIGTSGGQLKAILADRVLVEERMRTWHGRVVRQDRVLSLGAPRG